MNMLSHPRLLAVPIVLLAAACAQLPNLLGEPAKPAKPAMPAAAPQITESSLRERAVEQLAAGAKQFDAGDFENAVKSLTGSLDHGMLSKADQSRARKLLAFSHCVSGREGPCRDEFRKAFEINADFSLTAAEDGHPIWGPIYRNVRTQLIAEREATQARKPSFMPFAKAEQMLSDGMVKYDSGDYDASLRLLEASYKEGLKDKADQVRALKHIAFSLCLKERFPQCRAAFIKIYEVDANFDLAPAEAGHPSWTRTFAGAKAQAKRDLAAKRGAPPTAGVPTKK